MFFIGKFQVRPIKFDCDWDTFSSDWHLEFMVAVYCIFDGCSKISKSILIKNYFKGCLWRRGNNLSFFVGLVKLVFLEFKLNWNSLLCRIFNPEITPWCALDINFTKIDCVCGNFDLRKFFCCELCTDFSLVIIVLWGLGVNFLWSFLEVFTIFLWV